MIIDLRSDTVTRPGAAMMEFMMQAKVGDDVYGEDPTVNELEEKTAKRFGYESGMYCPSGTMTNQVAIKTHTQPGDELICDITSHIYNYEGGGIAFNSGVQVRAIHGNGGKLTAQEVLAHIQPDVINLPHTSLVALENTLNKAGGACYTLKEIEPISEICKGNNLALHLDGARIFNALVETGDQAIGYSKYFDSISICFSKGLGAPVGSVLLGNKDFINKARRVRRVFGGGMRQAGIMAAGALYALENNVERLKEDHIRAKEIAKVLKNAAYVEELLPVETNIIIFKLNDSLSTVDFIAKLRSHDIVANAMGKQMMRFVTHLDFDDKMLDKVVSVLTNINAKS
jgi:threonine aldolase